jgi:outer membrane receptor for ferrienterochelin and colicin
MRFSGINWKLYAFFAGYHLALLNISQVAQAQEEVNQSGQIELPLISVSAKAIKPVSNTITDDVGASNYGISQTAIEDMPLGASTPFNQLILQAPGASQDSYGQIHIRGEHGNLQYRINGIVIPESISGFSQSLDTRFFEQVNLITGALPAAYGMRTAGIVDIHTKTGTDYPQGNISVLYGQHNTINPSIEYGASENNLDYYFTAQIFHNDLGIESPTSSRNPIHDSTNQMKGFGYLSYLLKDNSRVTLMLGASISHFQIPNNPNQTPVYSSINGNHIDLSSANLNENQLEQTYYTVLSYQGKISPLTDYQVSLFSRYSEVNYKPDLMGDLIYNGIASKVLRSNFSHGIQNDLTFRLDENNLIKYGLSISKDRAINNNSSTVFSTAPWSDTPISIIDNTNKRALLTNLYLQDEWLVFKDLTVNLGIRADYAQTYLNEGQLSPRLGVVYNGLPKTTLHAGYARYFTPAPTELISASSIALFENTTNAPKVTQNDLVKSERSNYFDIGVSHNILPEWTIGIDAYYKDVNHLLDEGQFGKALIFTPFNYSQGKIYGLEISNIFHRGHFNGYLNIATSRAMGKNIESAQFNFSQSELHYIANNWVHLDHDQALTASAGINYAFEKFTLGTNAIFGSGMRSGFANTRSLPAYAVFNLSVGKDFNSRLLGNLNTKVALLNMFDRVYEIRDGSGIGVGAPQFGQRRSLLISISKDF